MNDKNCLTLYLVLGLPGSGKSSFVESVFGSFGVDFGFCEKLRPNTHRICFDSLRRAMGHEYLAATEPMVNAIAYVSARSALIEGRDVLVDESITRTAIALEFATIAREFSARMRIIVVDTPANVCRANRIPYGFPERDFTRKEREWAESRASILTLADAVWFILPTPIPKKTTPQAESIQKAGA